MASQQLQPLLADRREDHLRRAVMVVLVLTLLLVSACSGQTADPTTTALTSTPSTAPADTTTTVVDNTTTTGVTSTTTPAAEQTVTVVLYPFSEMGPGWTEEVFLYGEGEESLGTSPGGEGLMFGPDYGTQNADGTWWFLDAAKQRIAHFAPGGNYLDQVGMPEELLVDGIYFQYQLPQALDDGSLVASGWRDGATTSLLRIKDGTATGDTFDGEVAWVTTDGTYLYGHTVEENALQRLDPNDPVAEPIDWFIARDGSRYRVTVNEDEILVELPDAAVPLTRTLLMRYSEDPDVIARGAVEVETGADGTLFMLLYGVPISREPLDIGGLLTISPDGEVSEAIEIANLFSSADTGSPARLGVTPGSSDPWIMVVGEDGIHVFSKVAPGS
jgi:hypothetical protein